MTTQTLGERIRAARQAAGLSQEKLAERLGLTRQAVTKWETGQSAPSTENLLRLAEVLGVPVTALLDASAPEQQMQADQIYALQKEQARRAPPKHCTPFSAICARLLSFLRAGLRSICSGG